MNDSSAESEARFRLGAWEMQLVQTDESLEASDQIAVKDVPAALQALETAVRSSPTTAAVLADLLQASAVMDERSGLIAESLAYSMLMAGTEHRAWLASRTRRPLPHHEDAAVLLERDRERLVITLNRPSRHNAYSAEIRDGLCAALDLVQLDGSIRDVHLRGAGRSFCSGGDLDEFGTSRDVAFAHLIRRERSAAELMSIVGSRVTAHLHGATIGAGIEISSFAARVVAAEDTVIRLPEVSMGLVPGAGGTVGITRRIGPWRTLFLALTGIPLAARRALAWGLVDDVVP
ncbi:MAG: enoyl-CoA hydratase/isomerase family protein [Microbacterium sp.]